MKMTATEFRTAQRRHATIVLTRHGMTLSEIARLLGVNRNTIENYSQVSRQHNEAMKAARTLYEAHMAKLLGDTVANFARENEIDN